MPAYQFKWGLFDKFFNILIPESFSDLLAFNLGPYVTDFGWTSDRIARGTDDLDWIGNGPNATKALAGGVKKMVLAAPLFPWVTGVLAKSKNFRNLSIRIGRSRQAPALRLLSFSDIEVLDTVITDFSKLPPGFVEGQASYVSIFVKVHDPTVDVFTGLELPMLIDHSKEKEKAQQTIRRGQFLDDLARELSKP